MEAITYVQRVYLLENVMAKKHLSAGSEEPPEKAGTVRLYGMRFCPYVQRIRIVLNAKGVDFEEIFIDLKNKPEWLFKVHPDGKVPALEDGDKIVIESLDIAEYLDAKYPEPPLYPKPERKDEDKELISLFGKVSGAMGRAFHDKEKRPIKEYMQEILKTLEEFEKELEKRGTPFFSGEKPGMVDFMMWPWTERSKMPALINDEEFTFPKEKYPKLVAWRLAMQEYPPVQETIIDADKHLRFLKKYLSGVGDYLDDEF